MLAGYSPNTGTAPFYASSVISLRGRLTHGRMNPWDRSSSFSASSLSICTPPLSSLVAHVPQLPCRQPDGINTPFLSELSNRVWSGDTLYATTERENLISSEPRVAVVGPPPATAPPKLSCRILEGSTARSFSKARPSSMNAGGPHKKNVDSKGFSISRSKTSCRKRPFQPVQPELGRDNTKT